MFTQKLKKQLALAVMVMVLPVCAKGQIVREWYDSTYYWWGFEDINVTNMTGLHFGCPTTAHFPGYLCQTFYTPDTIAIYGMAVVLSNDPFPQIWPFTNRTITSYGDTIYRRYTIYQQTGGHHQVVPMDTITLTSELLDSVRKREPRFLHYYLTDTSCNMDSVPQFDTILEFYFDRPQYVYDTFYAGETYPFAYNERYYSKGPNKEHGFMISRSASTGLISFSETGGGQPDFALMSLPIIANPNAPICDGTLLPCPAPPAPTLLDCTPDDGSAVLLMPTGYGQVHLQLAYGTDTLTPENNTLIDFPSELEFLSHLDTGVCYHAWLRRECRHQCPLHDTLYWGDWSDPLSFILSNGFVPQDSTVTDSTVTDSTGTDPESILRLIETDEGLQVYPNPTRDELCVQSVSSPLQAIEIFDPQGKVVLKRSPIDSLRYTLDLRTLPTGTYILRATTVEGSHLRSIVKR